MGADAAQLGMAQAMKRKLLAKAKDGAMTLLIPDANAASDTLQCALVTVGSGDVRDIDEKTFKELKERRMVKQEYDN